MEEEAGSTARIVRGAASGALDDARDDPVAGAAGRVGPVIVGFGVNDEGAAVLVEERVLASGQRHPVGGGVVIGGTVLAHGYVLQVACVRSLRIIEPVLRSRRVEVFAGSFEVRRDISLFVNMDTVLTRLESLQDGRGDVYTVLTLPQLRVTDRFTLLILQLRGGRGRALGASPASREDQ